MANPQYRRPMEGEKQKMESEKIDFIDKKIKIPLAQQQTHHTEGLWKGNNKEWNEKGQHENRFLTEIQEKIILRHTHSQFDLTSNQTSIWNGFSQHPNKKYTV